MVVEYKKFQYDFQPPALRSFLITENKFLEAMYGLLGSSLWASIDGSGGRGGSIATLTAVTSVFVSHYIYWSGKREVHGD